MEEGRKKFAVEGAFTVAASESLNPDIMVDCWSAASRRLIPRVACRCGAGRRLIPRDKCGLETESEGGVPQYKVLHGRH